MSHDDLDRNLTRVSSGDPSAAPAQHGTRIALVWASRVLPMTGAAKRIVLESLGWVLLVLGVAAIFLPGPGLLGIFAGLALLSQQYDWAERRVEPVRLRALQGAAEGVETWPRIIASCLGAVVLAAFGVLWIVKPPSPDWWPLSDTWWLPGGIWTGVTQIGSAIIALALIAYSYRRFHGKPEAVEELRHEIDDRHDARTSGRQGNRV
jgi:hypothetical protein